MPSTRIATGTWANGKEAKLIDAVQSALVSSLRIPDFDRDVVIDLYDGPARIVPTGRSERFTRIEISMFAGRTIETKRLLYSTIVENVSSLGVPADEIKIVLTEIPAENWGIRGGQPASEIDLGFKIDV